MKIKMPYMVVLFFCLLGCQTTENEVSLPVNYHSLFLDSEFPEYKNIIIESEEEIFALNDDMREMIAEDVIPVRGIRERAIKLVTQIFETNDIDLSYVSGANLTARQAYQQNIANCLSLTILAYALAKEAKLNVRFQEVNIPEYWVRQGNFNMLTGHINLVVNTELNPLRSIIYGQDKLVLDFDPFVSKKSFPSRTIDKNTVLAMFYNNKGGQALINLNYLEAYAYLKNSIETSPTFSPAWGNLGLLYKMKDIDEFAELSYRNAIKFNNKNLTAMTNLSILLREHGHDDEADDLDRKLENKRINNPYYFALLADEAFYNSDYKSSIKLYKKAIKLNQREHEFHFGLAKAYYQLGKYDSAQFAIKKAIAVNRLPDIDNKYQSKLNFLKKVEVTH